MTLFFQEPGLLWLLLTLPQVRRAQRVLFFRYLDLTARPSRPSPSWLCGLTRRLNPRAEIGELPQENYLRLWQENNRESDEIMEAVFERVRRAPSFGLLSARIRSPHLERYHKLQILPWLLSETLFYRVARALDREEPLTLVPARRDRWGLHRFFLSSERWNHLIPPQVRFFLRIREGFKAASQILFAKNVLRLAAFSAQPVLRLLSTGRVTWKLQPLRAEVIQPIVSGLRPGGESQEVGHDDRFLLGGALDSSRLAFYFSDWTSRERKGEQVRLLREAGLQFFDPGSFPADLRFLGSAALFLGRLWAGAAAHPGLWAEDPEVARASARLARHFLKEWHFAASVEFKVLVEFQDYSPAHVVRTVVADRLGRQTVGMHHGNPAAPLILPALRYACLSRLLVWGGAFVRMHGRHWEAIRQVPMGAYRSDLILQAQDSPRLQELKAHYQARYGGTRPLILMLFPSMEWYILRDRVREQIEGLKLLRSLPQPFRILCRFRSPHWRERWLEAGLREVLASDSRIGEADPGLTTYEWIAVSDGVVAHSHSSAVIEAAVVGKPCASFDHMLSGERVFGPYLPGWIFKDREELVRGISRFVQGDRDDSGGREALARDFSYFSDGRCIARFREAVLEAAGVGRPRVEQPRPEEVLVPG